ncbi:MAG: YkgJ family cysteine cluster protein [Deltaproteobacteria bacterium]|nr:YkgJ family cysteine cluster protein [Deltaproteobacteria bacterium]MBW2100661.1 YkgJ family cysteine cluster protein [Deltaproteobacteria bacterium]
MSNEMTPLSLDDTFSFSCTKSVPCFNECCRDLNQFLTPYDILRLKNHFDMSSNLFLERYTMQHIGPESGFPIITLKTNDTSELTCPFVTPEGCSVYKNRPSSCRTYPLARVASRSRETGRITEHYMLLKEPHCLGFNQPKTQTVREWIVSQDIAVYNEMNDLLMEIISLKNRLMPGPLDIKSRMFFYMACYDLDTFRSHIFEKGILKDHNLDADTLDSVKKDDEALLKLGLKSIKKVFFGDQ